MWRNSRCSRPSGSATCQKCRRERRPAAEAAKPPPPIRIPRTGRTCEMCGVEYRANKTGQRTCDRYCGRALQLGRYPSSPVRWVACRRCGLTFAGHGHGYCRSCPPSSRRSPGVKARVRLFDCERCGRQFVHRGTARRFCGSDCPSRARKSKNRPGRDGNAKRSKDRKRARFHGACYEPIRRARVYERDLWMCGICHLPVDNALEYPHPMSASLDHRVPLSRGGDHLYSNVQCAHLACNLDKGAGPELTTHCSQTTAV